MYSLKEGLIDKDVPINIINNSVSCNSFESTQLKYLHLLLELHLNNTPGASKELLLQVTDEANPLLLLSTNITENGYQNLRSSQGLLVDFNSFPHHFSNLIKRCLEEQQKESPKFALVLRTTGNEIPVANDGGIGKVCLEVVELNAFKHLCHLSLSLIPASLQAKLTHLSSCIKVLKNSLNLERENAQREISRLSDEIQSLHGKYSTKTSEYETMKEELEEKLRVEVQKYTKILMEEKEAVLKNKSDCDRRIAREKREIDNKYSGQLRDLKEENNGLRKRISDMNAKNEGLEDALREMRQKLKDHEERSKRHTKELNNLAKERAELKRDSDIKEESNRKLIAQVAQQEKNIQELDAIIQRNSSQFATLGKEKNSLMESLESCQMKLEKREDNLRKLLVDFQKSLEIIKKFKQKIKRDEEQINSLISITDVQEQTLLEREKELKNTKEEKEKLTKRFSNVEAELKDKENKLKEAGEKIMSQENDLKKNENVITWLNKRLNEIETTEVLMKKAPLAEVYLHSQNLRTKFTTNTPTLTTSTPLSTHTGISNFIGSSQSKVHSLSSVPALNDIPKIPEEIGPETREDKENLDGLDTRYLEPSQSKMQQFPVRGILRANAISKPEAKAEDKEKNTKKTVKTKFSEQNRRSKFGASKQSAYFGKS